jgi:hypothetical protein
MRKPIDRQRGCPGIRTRETEMDKIFFAILAASITAFAMLAPAHAGAFKPGFARGPNVIRIDDNWHARVLTPACWTKRMLKYDYAGNLYLKKVRVCA